MVRSKHILVGVLGLFPCLSLLGCGGSGGGGSGGGGSPFAAQTSTVSGTVQAPGGQIASHSSLGLLQQLAEFISPSAYGSIIGLSPVPDGTDIQLVRLNSTGTSFAVLSSTATTGGRYSFNLTELGLQPSNDLALRVANGAVQMRAFMTGSNVDIDPASETAVQLVLEQILGTPGATINNYTVQELADITGSMNMLATTKQVTAGLNIASTVTSIRNALATETALMAFINASAGTGQTAEGPGDIGNYFPFEQGNMWRYQGTMSIVGRPQLNFMQSISISGVKVIGGVTTTIFRAENDSEGPSRETYDAKDSRGVTNYGNNDSSDPMTPQLVPLRYVRFPMVVDDTVQVVNRKGLNSGLDLDGDGIPEKVDSRLEYTILGFETVTVPAGVFSHSVKIELRQTDTFFSSAFGISASVKTTQTEWLAPGIGFITKTTLIWSEGFSEDFSETITMELVGGVANGQGVGLRVQVTPTSLSIQPGLSKQLQATAFDQANAALSGVGFTWMSNDPSVAQVTQDGTVTGVAPGAAKVTASAFGLTSNAVQVTVNEIRILSLTTNDIIYDKVRHRIYASIPGTATSNPNSIMVIDPLTGSTGPSIGVGSEPTKLAISDDSEILYVGLDGEGAVREVDLSTFTIGSKFTLGTSFAGCGPLKAFDLKVLPGTSRSLAVVRTATLCSPLFTVAIYDNGLQRTNTTSEAFDPRVTTITFGQTKSTLFGYDGATTGFQFVRMAVDALGVSMANITTGLLTGFGVTIEFDSGRIYASNGTVIDPVTMTIVGTLNDPLLTFQSLIKPDSSLGRVFVVSGNLGTPYTLFAFDMSSFKLTGSMSIEGIIGGPPIGPPGVASLIRWGSDGIAFRSSLQIAFVRTASIQ